MHIIQRNRNSIHLSEDIIDIPSNLASFEAIIDIIELISNHYY